MAEKFANRGTYFALYNLYHPLCIILYDTVISSGHFHQHQMKFVEFADLNFDKI